MVCKRCGRDNHPKMARCAYCGTLLYDARQRAVYGSNVNNAQNKNRKQTETIIVVVIIVLVAVLGIMTGAYIYRANKPRTGAFHGGGGGGGMNRPIRAQETQPPLPTSTPYYSAPSTPAPPTSAPPPTAKPPTPAPQPTAKPPTPAPPPTQAPQNDRAVRKQEYLDRAARIQERYYSYAENMMSQADMNRESAEIFEEWDLLLNDIYQYLKSILSESRFNSLRESELEWIAEKERAIEEAAEDWRGGSGEPMIRNGVAIDYTSERCYYLISLIE